MLMRMILISSLAQMELPTYHLLIWTRWNRRIAETPTGFPVVCMSPTVVVLLFVLLFFCL